MQILGLSNFGKTYRLRKRIFVLYTEKKERTEELHKKIRK